METALLVIYLAGLGPRPPDPFFLWPHHRAVSHPINVRFDTMEACIGGQLSAAHLLR